MATVSVIGNNVRNCLSAARKALGKRLKEAQVVSITEHDDGLSRAILSSGDVVEVTTRQHARCEATVLP